MYLSVGRAVPGGFQAAQGAYKRPQGKKRMHKISVMGPMYVPLELGCVWEGRGRDGG